MTDVFNYCTTCGDELPDDRAEAAAETNLPPICEVCTAEVVFGLPRPLAAWKVSADRTVATAARELSRPLAGVAAAASNLMGSRSPEDETENRS